MKLTENPQNGSFIQLGDLRRLVKRAEVMELTDDSSVLVTWGRKSHVKTVSVEESTGPGL
jgi:hypothetical protein